MINKKLMDILACPACKSDVTEEDGKIVCKSCLRRYSITDGIPVMLIDEAQTPISKKQRG